MNKDRVVPAESFCATLAANIDNEKVPDSDFREFCRNTIDSVQFPREDDNPVEELRNRGRTSPNATGWWWALHPHATDTSQGEIVGVRTMRNQPQALGLTCLDGPKTIYDFAGYTWTKLEYP